MYQLCDALQPPTFLRAHTTITRPIKKNKNTIHILFIGKNGSAGKTIRIGLRYDIYMSVPLPNGTSSFFLLPSINHHLRHPHGSSLPLGEGGGRGFFSLSFRALPPLPTRKISLFYKKIRFFLFFLLNSFSV